MIRKLNRTIFKVLLGLFCLIIAGNLFTFLTGQSQSIIQPVAYPFLIPLSVLLVVNKLLPA